MSSVSQTVQDFESLLVTLQDSLGVVVSDDQRGDLAERVLPLLASYQLDSFSSLAQSIETDETGKIRSEVLVAISQSKTSWGQVTEIRDVLQNYIFDQLPEDARIWVVGCEQGQLAYSVAMEIADYHHQNNSNKKINIIASDVAQSNIDYAQAATYTVHQMSGMSDEHKKLYISIDANDGSATIKDKIRQIVDFKLCDLNDDFRGLGQMDLIICLESLAYFSSSIKANMLQRLAGLLKSGGIFLTGDGQNIMLAGNSLERVDHPAGVFYRQKN
jgi:chemotaxis methyl-accepting protein methylase